MSATQRKQKPQPDLNRTINFRMTGEEYKQLTASAKTIGLSTSCTARKAIERGLPVLVQQLAPTEQ